MSGDYRRPARQIQRENRRPAPGLESALALRQRRDMAASTSAVPQGEIVIRTIAMPADTNANGDIFGGWLMSQMDLGGAVLARALARSRVVTVAVESMAFLHPVAVGDTVTCYATLVAIGRTSLKIDVAAWVQRFADGAQHRVTEGVFTYVAIDDAGKPQAVKRGP
jgi:acyl-CoA thioesterase YciA